MKLLGRSFTTQEKQIWERSSRRKSHWPPPSAPEPFHKVITGSSYKLLPVAFYAILRNSTSLRTSAAALVWQSVIQTLSAGVVLHAMNQNHNGCTIPYDQQALADFLGIKHSAMSAKIGKLRRNGVLETKDTCFQMLWGNDRKTQMILFCISMSDFS